MQILAGRIAVAVVVFILLFSSSVSAGARPEPSAFVPDEILIGLRPETVVSLPGLPQKLPTLGIPSLDKLSAKYKVQSAVQVFDLEGNDTLAERIGLRGILKLVVPPGTDIFSMIQELSSDPVIEYAEPNRIYQASELPLDTGFGRQWGLHNTGQASGRKDADIDGPEAWDLEKGEGRVTIAIIDTGIDYEHPDLGGGRVLTPLGWDFVNDDNDPMDDHGHGTFVAGIAAADSNNGIGIAGVCWQCRVLPVKVLNSDGKGTSEWLAQGIQYAADHNAQVINMSLGYSSDCGCSKTVAKAINYAYERGALLVAASGNDSDKKRISYPASSPRVLAVGATDRQDQEAKFSNRDASLDILAPGKDIYSLNLSTKEKKYEAGSGTSAATPFVTGVAGLIFSAHPGLRPAQVWHTLRATAEVVGKGTKALRRLNARRALTTVSSQDFPAPVDTCDMEADCPAGCGAEIALAGSLSFHEALGTLRDLRDRVLEPTALGKEWVEAYQRHRREVALLLLRDEILRSNLRAVLGAWAPLFQAAVSGSEVPVSVTERQVRLAEESIDRLMARGSAALREDLEKARGTLEEKVLIVGKNQRDLIHAIQDSEDR